MDKDSFEYWYNVKTGVPYITAKDHGDFNDPAYTAHMILQYVLEKQSYEHSDHSEDMLDMVKPSQNMDHVTADVRKYGKEFPSPLDIPNVYSTKASENK